MKSIRQFTCLQKPFECNDAKEAMKKKDRENQLMLEEQKKAN